MKEDITALQHAKKQHRELQEDQEFSIRSKIFCT